MSTPIECKLIREGGSFPEVGGIIYHFEPYTDGAHVCQVEDSDHADQFLAIREGYSLYRGKGRPAKGAQATVIDKAYEAEKSAKPVPESEQERDPEQREQEQPAETADDREALEAEYQELYGQPAHHNTSDRKLREKIAAKKEQK